MAKVRLIRVRVEATPDDLPRLLAALLASGRFHPARGEGLAQEIRIVLLASRAQELYGQAGDLLADPKFRGLGPAAGPPSEFRATDVRDALRRFDDDLAILRRNLPLLEDPGERAAVLAVLRGVREGSLLIFRNLHRLLTRPGSPGRIAIDGFVPEPDLDAFRARLGPFLVDATPVAARGPDNPFIPTLLVNPRVVALFERFALERGVPKYNEIDPTPIIALVFPLFFGFMFGDLGHGLALLALGLYLARRTKFVYWGQLIAVFGVAAGIVGVVRGVVFGVTFASPFGAYLAFLPALDARFTLAYIPLLLEAAIVVGTFHLASAYAFAVVNQLRSLRYAEAFLAGIPTLVLYVSLVPLGFAFLGAGFHPDALLVSHAPTPFLGPFLGLSVPVSVTATVTLPLAVAALAVLVLGPPVRRYASTRSGRKTLRALADGALAGASRPAEFFLNTISYVRLAALLVANTLLGGLVARALAFGIAGVALAALLNVLVMGMEGLIVYLQDWRLHMFEWFTKFYAGTGTAFEPLAATGTWARFRWEAAAPAPGAG